MTTLLSRSAGYVDDLGRPVSLRCDAVCHRSRAARCSCICGGRYHGLGDEGARRLLADDLDGIEPVSDALRELLDSLHVHDLAARQLMLDLGERA